MQNWHKAVTKSGYRYGPSVLVIAATEQELTGAKGARTVVCGIGPVEAAAATARAIAADRPRAVLHVGIAGSRTFADPELVLGTESVYYDATSARAFPDPALLAAARAAFPHAPAALIGTSARVGGTTGSEYEAMEGFAVLRACELAGVPALEVRVTSNEISEPDRARWRFDDAFALLAASLPALIEALDA